MQRASLAGHGENGGILDANGDRNSAASSSSTSASKIVSNLKGSSKGSQLREIIGFKYMPMGDEGLNNVGSGEPVPP